MKQLADELKRAADRMKFACKRYVDACKRFNDGPHWQPAPATIIPFRRSDNGPQANENQDN